MNTTKKKAIAVIEFDDTQSNFSDATDFATYLQSLLEKDFADCDVTVYSTPEDLNADIEEGIGAYAKEETEKSQAIARDSEYEDTSDSEYLKYLYPMR